MAMGPASSCLTTLILVSGLLGYGQGQYVIASDITYKCSDDGLATITDATECCVTAAAELGQPVAGGGCPTDGTPSPLSNAILPAGCSFISGTINWNEDQADGDWERCFRICASPPTQVNPNAGGDPIAIINGFRVKFDLPMNENTLLWEDEDGFAIFARADLVSPDKKSQWFSDFFLFQGGRQAAHIQRKASDKATTERPGMLNTLVLTITDEAGRQNTITDPGSYQICNGTTKIVVKRDGTTVGPLHREVVTVTSKASSFTVSPERAKKFSKMKQALKFSHLNINFQQVSKHVKRGLFAEMWGFVPMSKKTARLIRSLEQVSA